MNKLILLIFTVVSLNTFGQTGQPIHVNSLGGNYPRSLYVFNDKLYFTVSSSASGDEMWVYDNTFPISSTNPKMLIDLDTSSNSTFPRQYFEYNGKLFFTNNNAVYSYVDNQPISQNNPRYICPRGNGFTIYNNKLYFEVSGSSPRTIWVFDDNLPVSGTNPQRLVNPTVNPIITSNVFKPFVFQNKMYFSATSNSSLGEELWVYDASISTSASNPSMFAEINIGTNGSSPYDFILYKNKMYFSANDGTGSELWVYDGTAQPYKVYDIDPSPYGGVASYKTILDDTLYFAGHENQFGTELWKYDGTNPPSLVADVYSGSNFSIPSNLKVFGNRLIFNANNGTNGRELWCYNNSQPVSTSNPFLIYDLYAGSNNGIPSNGVDNGYVIYDNLMYFGAYGGSNSGLWALTLCNIGVATPPVFSLGNDTTIYVGDSVILSGPVQMTSYSWSNNAGNNYHSTFNGNTNNIGNNNISLTVVDSNSCSYSDNIVISVYSLDNFSLISPTNNSTNQEYSSLVLDWSNNTGATIYELQIDTTQTFTTSPQTYSISNSTQTVTLLPSKTYYWKVRASNGTTWGQWTTTWNFTTKSDQSSSIQELYFSDLKIYPNPTTDIITFETNNHLLNKPYKLLDYTGKEILSGIIKSEKVTVNLKTVSSGVYFLQIGDYPQQTYKLIKE